MAKMDRRSQRLHCLCCLRRRTRGHSRVSSSAPAVPSSSHAWGGAVIFYSWNFL